MVASYGAARSTASSDSSRSAGAAACSSCVSLHRIRRSRIRGKRHRRHFVVAFFATDVRQLIHWGGLPIVAWHGQATEIGWPVFGQDGAFAMLDTAGLLRAPSDAAPLAHHWSIVMSEPGRPLAILRDKREAVLVWGRLDGLVEWWSVDLATLKVACRF